MRLAPTALWLSLAVALNLAPFGPLAVGWASARAPIYVSSWAVRVTQGYQEAERLSRKFGFVNLGQIFPDGQYFHLRHRGVVQQSLTPHWGHRLHLKRDPKMEDAFLSMAFNTTKIWHMASTVALPLSAPQVTTDLHHQCTKRHTGTSASAPLAAGMIALALEANPLLSWRDLQHLVVRASKPAQLQAEDWRVNGVGRQVSHHYGYGLLDAGLLVDLARTWLPTKPQKKCVIRVVHAPTPILPRMHVQKNVSACSGRRRGIHSLEHVQVQLSLSYSRRGDLEISLTSPMGTRSTLVAIRPLDVSSKGYNNWIFMSTHYWDEAPQGLWTLGLENKGYYFNTGTLYRYTLLLYGTTEDMTRRPPGPQVTSSACVRRDTEGLCQERIGHAPLLGPLRFPACRPRFVN
ncbi:PREDICTED: proprotein convertase subtilisin/kexin type 4 [Dipodomys ordii]|uniref:Prohormone convertase 3 n=1 Tax=Dipodomys ordii TaxID=10020 RepID=A0A1S3FNL1_DIPOR|nr:PREDICTED: proprotein convertase subtilisin/kexin type 4 [Dipodomys ordii]